MDMNKKLISWMLASCLMFGAAPSFAGAEDKPSSGEMAFDLVVARPVGIFATVLGSAAFVVSLPFSALGGNVKEAADALVVNPARAAFVRCLGCKTTGRYNSAE